MEKVELKDYVDQIASELEQSQDGTEIPGIDTTPAFESIFQGKTQFDSWEEFITPFEEFQLVTNSVFKPKSSVCVNWINEKRANDKIPEKFVYSKVNMICQHFGLGVRKEGSTRKRESYVGQDCEAYMKLSYKKGKLHITKYNLVHSNHILSKSHAQAQMRKIRPVIFNDDLDLLVCKVAEDCNVFETRTSETNWQSAVTTLCEADGGLQHLTRRVLKKRLQFLMDRFASNCEGSEPLEDDEMGIILFRLLQQKEKVLTPSGPSKRGRKRKSHYTQSSPRTRSKSRHLAAQDEETEDTGFDMVEDGTEDFGESLSNPTEGAFTGADLGPFLSYWTKRDADERRMKWEEMKLRKEELELQKCRFELEQKERNTLMELLKTQGQILNTFRKATMATSAPATVPHQAPVTPSKAVTKEFILNKDGSLQPVNQEIHEEPKSGSGPIVMTVHNASLNNHSSAVAPMSGGHPLPAQQQTHSLAAGHPVGSLPTHGLAAHPNMAAHPHQANLSAHGHIQQHGQLAGHMGSHH